MSQKIHAPGNKYLICVDAILLLLLTAYVLAGVDLVPFHGDEATFIVMSEDYDKIVKERDFDRVFFNNEGNSKQYTRLTTGSILTFSIGFVRDITNTEGPKNRWLWGTTWDENVRLGNTPDPALLHLARSCGAWMGALSIALFFFTARFLFSSRLVAWTATLILASHGDFLVNIRRAIQEGPKFLFLVLALYIACHVLKTLQEEKAHRYQYVLLGIASGFTLAAKQDTAFTLVAVYLALTLIPIWKKSTVRAILANMIYLGAATTLTLACFLLLMPVFWGWWESALVLVGFAAILLQWPVWKIDRSAKWIALGGCLLIIAMSVREPTLWRTFLTPLVSMIETREIIVNSQVENRIKSGLSSLDTLGQRLMFLLRTTFTSRVMYMETSSFDVPPFHEQIRAYEDSPFKGRTGSPWVDGFIAALAIVGGCALLNRFNEQSLLIMSLLIISGILLMVTVPLPWQRYFLIMQIPYALIAGVGAGQIWQWRKLHLATGHKETK